MNSEIAAYRKTLSSVDQQLAEAIEAMIVNALPEAEGKVWHRHPVWFLDGNPVVGYHRLKKGIRILFWSGQSFATPGLLASGSFEAAELWPRSVPELEQSNFATWLVESRAIQWDYEHIMKNRGLVKRTDF